MGDHDGARAFAERGFELRGIGVISGRGDVDEDRHAVVLDDGIDGGGKTRGDGDHFIAGLESALAEPRRGETGKGTEVGGGAGVDQ